MEIEQDVHTVCCTCLSSDRDLFSLNGLNSLYQIFRLLIYDYTGDRYGESTMDVENLVCWECLALMKRFNRFKNQVQSAQEHLRILAMSHTQESVDHTYMSQSLSSLEATTKTEYDKIYLYYTQDEWPQSFIVGEDVKSEEFDVAQTVRENITLDIGDHILEVPEMVLQNPVTGVMSHLVVGTDSLVSTAETYKGNLNVTTIDNTKIEVLSHKKLKNDITNISDYVTDYVADREMILEMAVNNVEEKVELKYCLNTESTNKDVTSDKTCGYITDYMSEIELTDYREQLKEKIQYASSVYKCELCIIGFYTQQQVEDHFLSEHRAKPGRTACKVCYVYVEDGALARHTSAHYTRYTCKLCAHREYSAPLMAVHARAHLRDRAPASLIRIGDAPKSKKKSEKSSTKPPPKSGDLRKLLSKTTIEGYRCLECDMFFKNSRARKNHVARIHREGFQCDHCKKRFVNRTTLTTHLRLQHEGPLPRDECPICHKMVRVIQLKYHIQRHENKKTFLCVDCNKTFSHLATYQAHLKYSRAHASESFFKFPCPMCHKGYPSKEAMQDHFNYQHLGKTSHKCSICDKPIASRANVEKHMMRMHGQKKEKPKNHVCQTCGKGFTDKKALNQHEVIHSGERPLTCDICQQTFKQKASLYTHSGTVPSIQRSLQPMVFVDSSLQMKYYKFDDTTL